MNFKSLEKSQIVGIIISNFMLALYLVWLVYFCYFAKHITKLFDILKENFSIFNMMIIGISFGIGLFIISILYQTIIFKIFYQETKEEKDFNKAKKKIRNEMDKNNKDKREEIKVLKLKMKLKTLENKK